MDTTLETFEHGGLTVRIGWEDDSSPFNPREHENLAALVCWHPNYVLGDEQLQGGAVETAFATATGRQDFASMEVLERYLRTALGAVCVLPLYLLDHSGLSLSAGTNYVGRGDTASGGRDSWGNARGWDTSMVGFAYALPERIRELCGEPQLPTDPVYCPRLWPEDGRAGRNWPADRSALEWIEQQVRSEVSVYGAYLSGEVYWYAVEDERGEVLDSCGGFLGGGLDEQGRELDPLEWVRQEAREAAEFHRDHAAKTRAEGFTAMANGGRSL